MARNCNLVNDESGVLVCTVQHTKPKVCDLYEPTCEHGYPLSECEEA